MKKNSHDQKDTTGRKKIFFLLIIVVILIDRLTKLIALRFLNQDIKIIPGFFTLHFTVNTGAGFGLLQGRTILLSVITLLFVVIIFFYLRQILNENYYWAAALILGGAISNLFDRVFYSFVIDFLDFQFWPIFNAADTAISIGAAALFVYILKSSFKKKQTNPEKS